MDKNIIIQKHLAGQSNRTIAKQLGINRKTVDKYVKDFCFLQNQLANSEHMTKEEIRDTTQAIVEAPKYKRRSCSPRKYTKEMDAFLDEILAFEEKKKLELKTTKQQLTKTQIHALMVEEGFDIGFTTICNKVNEKRAVKKEAFIAQTYAYGQRFEYDFGEVHVYIAGKYTKLFLAVMSAPASGYRYALLYPNQKFSVFVDSQVRFFEHLGGCFSEGVYDNMRNVVSKFIGKNEKELNKGLINLSHYYGFKINVTNCYAGNEKGTVENAVKVIRNKAFATRYKFSSLQDAQSHLDAVLEKLNESSSIEEEKKYLSCYRPPLEIADLRAGVLVDKYSCVCVEGNFYSVPDDLVGKHVYVKNYPNDLVVIYNKRVVARHDKSLGKGEMNLNINHYLDTFIRKPGALANSCALSAIPQLKKIFDSLYADRPKEFIDILQANQDLLPDELFCVLSAHKGLPVVKQPNKPDAIAIQTMKQISCIRTLGKEVTYAC